MINRSSGQLGDELELHAPEADDVAVLQVADRDRAVVDAGAVGRVGVLDGDRRGGALMRLDGLVGPDGSTPRELRASFLSRGRARAALRTAPPT